MALDEKGLLILWICIPRKQQFAINSSNLPVELPILKQILEVLLRYVKVLA